MAERKLTEEQEKSLLVGYLCGVPLETLTRDYSVCDATIGNSILRGRSKEWNNSLVELYRAIPHTERQRNAMHLYLSLIGKDVENWDTVTLNRQIAKYSFEQTESGIVVPKTTEIAQQSGIETISKMVVTPSDKLIRTAVGTRKPESYVLPVFNKHAFEAYMDGNYSWDAIGETTLQDVASRVRRGDFSNSAYKQQVMSDVLNTLTFRERTVLEERFGLRDEKVKSLTEVGKVFSVPPERVRQIEAIAVRKLQHPQRAWKLAQIDSLATDEEIKERIAFGPGYKERMVKRENIPLDEIELSIRTRNALGRMGVVSLDQVTKLKAADLLSQRNFGETCLNELNETLASYGIDHRF